MYLFLKRVVYPNCRKQQKEMSENFLMLEVMTPVW